MVKEFKDSQVRKSGVIYESTWEQIKKLYSQNPEMAGELAISVIEQTLTGDISSTDFMIQIVCEGLKPINQNAQQKYDNRVKSNKEHKRETQQLDKIVELIDRGKTQEEIGKILGISRQTVSNRIKIIREEYPELIKVDKVYLQYSVIKEQYLHCLFPKKKYAEWNQKNTGQTKLENSRGKIMNYPAIRQCPVCGKYRFEVEFEECPICSWMNDVTQEENPDAKGLANIMSLNECRKAYAEGKEFY